MKTALTDQQRNRRAELARTRYGLKKSGHVGDELAQAMAAKAGGKAGRHHRVAKLDGSEVPAEVARAADKAWNLSCPSPKPYVKPAVTVAAWQPFDEFLFSTHQDALSLAAAIDSLRRIA